MPDRKTIRFEVPRRVLVHPGDVRTLVCVERRTLSAEIAVLDPHQAPIAVRASGIGIVAGQAPRDVVWRTDGHRYWRPILGLPEPDRPGAARGPGGEGESTWRDHPTGRELASACLGRAKVEPGGDRGRWKCLSFDGEAVDWTASRKAESELAEIGGVLHRRADPPAWAVDRLAGDAGSRAVRLAIPEHLDLLGAVDAFPAGRLDVALDAGAGRFRGAATDGARRPSPPTIGTIWVHRELAEGRTVAIALAHAVDAIERALRPCRIGDLSRRTLEAYAFLLTESERLRERYANVDRSLFEPACQELQVLLDGLRGPSPNPDVSETASAMLALLRTVTARDERPPCYRVTDVDDEDEDEERFGDDWKEDGTFRR